MAQAAYKHSGFNRERVIGMAGVLDSGRFKSFIAAGAERQRGEHDRPSCWAAMATPWFRCRATPPSPEFPSPSSSRPSGWHEIVQRTRDGGGEIVKHLKTGSAYYAPSAAAVEMAEVILKDKKKILPCAAYLEGEYGISGYYIGVPCKLGAGGLEQIIEIKLTEEEDAALKKSAAAVKELCDVIGV